MNKTNTRYIILRNRIERLVIAVLCIIAVILIFASSAAADGVAEGLKICSDILVPSLFPFMVLADFMVKSGTAELLSKVFLPVTKLVFGKSTRAGCVFIMSVLGGYPVGTRAARTLFEQGKISGDEAAKMICFCLNSGPAFMVTAIGTVLLGSVNAGLILLFSNTAAAMLTGALFMRLPVKAKNPYTIKTIRKNMQQKTSVIDTFVSSVASSCSAMFAICGFVALFSCFIAVLRTLPLPPQTTVYLQPFLEVSAGCIALAKNSALLPAVSAALAFGGLCVHFQSLSIAKGLAPAYSVFFASRLLHALLAALITYLFRGLYEPALSAMAYDAARNARLFSGHPAASIALLSTAVFLLFDLKKTELDLKDKGPKRVNPFEAVNRIFK